MKITQFVKQLGTFVACLSEGFRKLYTMVDARRGFETVVDFQ
ncbi:MAG: hypothetical protein ACR2NK_19665 [Mariniblastus sp.]